MARSSSSQQQTLNPLGAPSVVGLEAGREAARREQRRRRFRDSVTSGLGAVVGIAVLAAAAYVGYSIYDEQRANERLEAEERRAQTDQQGSGDDLRDAIDELEQQPKWNGPGNPNFGVGDGG